MSRNYKYLKDIIKLDNLSNSSNTFFSDSYFVDTYGNDCYLLISAEVDSGTISIVDLESKSLLKGEKKAASVLATGDLNHTPYNFKIKFIGTGWADKNSGKNSLIQIPEIYFSFDENTTTLEDFNNVLRNTIIAEDGIYKNQPLSNWLEFASKKELKLKDIFSGPEYGFEVIEFPEEGHIGKHIGSNGDSNWNTVATFTNLSSTSNFIISSFDYIKDNLRAKLTTNSFSGNIRIGAVVYSEDTKTSNSMGEIKEIESFYYNKDSMQENAVVYTKPLKTGVFNEKIVASASFEEGDLEDSILISEIAFEAGVPKTIYNTDSFRVGTPGAGKSSPHVSYYDDLSNAIWYRFKENNGPYLESIAVPGDFFRIKFIFDDFTGINETKGLKINLRMHS